VVPALGQRAYGGSAAVEPAVRGARPAGTARSRRCAAWADYQVPGGASAWERSTSAGVWPGAGCGTDAEGGRHTGAAGTTSRRKAPCPFLFRGSPV
jgi:hypothetical protein